ncbi:MAG: DUF4136 domain-containing protein [Gammaproteobacteria bacterium]
MDTRFARRLAGTLGVLALAGCAAVGPEISTDYDTSVDFSQYATFSFMDRAERGQALTYDTIGDRRVIASVTRELEARGYRRVESDAELLVNFAMATEDIQDVRTVPSAGLPPPWYGWRGGYYYPWPAYSYETYVDRYERGTLFIDLVDAERRQLVWEGRAVGRITKSTREDPAGALDNAVAEIFARYPFVAGPQR